LGADRSSFQHNKPCPATCCTQAHSTHSANPPVCGPIAMAPQPQPHAPAASPLPACLPACLPHMGNSLLCTRPNIWRGRFLNITMPAGAHNGMADGVSGQGGTQRDGRWGSRAGSGSAPGAGPGQDRLLSIPLPARGSVCDCPAGQVVRPGWGKALSVDPREAQRTVPYSHKTLLFWARKGRLACHKGGPHDAAQPGAVGQQVHKRNARGGQVGGAAGRARNHGCKGAQGGWRQRGRGYR